jgi:uncharacterized protein YodC (DUF2158 family)
MSESINVGSVVRLKSGGCRMLVLAAGPTVTDPSQHVRCTWDGQGKTEPDVFLTAAVELAGPDIGSASLIRI